MKIIVLSEREAIHFRPAENERTAMMRIHGTSTVTFPVIVTPLMFESEFVAVFKYFFDDVDQDVLSYINEKFYGITKETAAQIRKDFESIKNNIDTLVVHCKAGISRSRATALALNDLYNLNAIDEDEIKLNGPYARYNRFVYGHITEWKKEYEENQKRPEPIYAYDSLY